MCQRIHSVNNFEEHRWSFILSFHLVLMLERVHILRMIRKIIIFQNISISNRHLIMFWVLIILHGWMLFYYVIRRVERKNTHEFDWWKKIHFLFRTCLFLSCDKFRSMDKKKWMFIKISIGKQKKHPFFLSMVDWCLSLEIISFKCYHKI